MKVAKTSSENSDPIIEFQIIDTGIGIPVDKQNIVFERFQQAHDSSHYEGTGLGLAITKDIVEKMNGKISFESREGFGTKFFVTIPDTSQAKPLKKDYSASIPANVANYNDEKEKNRALEYHILVAEDYGPNATLIEYILYDYGYNSTIVTNGQAVLDVLEKQQVDMILMDINMPTLNGIETTYQIREKEKYKHLPIIAMSAHVFEKEKQDCFNAGMNEYVTKPLDNDLLYEKIKSLLPEESNKISAHG